MSQFAQGARAAGEAAGRALFEKFRRDWASAVCGLDAVVESRAVYRGASDQILAEAQLAALDGMQAAFDEMFAEWATVSAETTETVS